MTELSLERCCIEEYRLLGFCVSAHPLMLMRSAPTDVVPACRMNRFVGKPVRMLGWAIASKLIRTRGKGVFMKFLSCEDLTGTFEATLFPETYQRVAPLTLGPGPYLLTGKIENDQGALSIVVDDLEVVEIGLEF